MAHTVQFRRGRDFERFDFRGGSHLMFVSITHRFYTTYSFYIVGLNHDEEGNEGVSEQTVELIRSVMAVYALSNVPYRI